MDLALNLPEKIHDIFVADIAHCYEAIPLEGSDNLMRAIRNSFHMPFARNELTILNPNKSCGYVLMRTRGSPLLQNGHLRPLNVVSGWKLARRG